MHFTPWFINDIKRTRINVLLQYSTFMSLCFLLLSKYLKIRLKLRLFGNIRLWRISLQKFTHLDLSLSPPFLFISILLLVVEKSLNWTSNPKTTYQILVLLTINNIIAAYFNMCCSRMKEDECSLKAIQFDALLLYVFTIFEFMIFVVFDYRNMNKHSNSS